MKKSFRLFTLSITAMIGLAFQPVAVPEEQPVAVQEEQTAASSVYQNLELFASVLEIVSKNYVREVNNQELIYGALKGMLGSLDSYSQFMDPETYEEMKVETKGEFGGLGIEITLRNDILTIITPIEDTPASRAGLRPGDRIVQINGGSTKNMTLVDAVKSLRGKPGTEVTITVMRLGEKELLDFTLAREIIPIRSVRDVKVLEGGIGYLRLSQFHEDTVREFDQAMEQLKEKEIRGLILDLRYNPGGTLQAAVEVADRFLDRGKIIVQAIGRNEQVEAEIKATQSDRYPELPIVILINEGTASGSEIVAGALRDHHRAILVGDKTFGKGSVQSVLPLRDASAIRLTTAYYYTASHRLINEVGIEPDIKISMTDEEKRDHILKRYEALKKLEDVFEQEEAETIPPVEKEEKKPEGYDPQLQRAVDVLKGITLFRDFQLQLGEKN